MSFTSYVMYSLKCDICGAILGEGEEIVAWTDEESAKLMAEEAGWTLKNGKHYCSNHWICEAPQCHNEGGPLAGEQDYLCDVHWAAAQMETT